MANLKDWLTSFWEDEADVLREDNEPEYQDLEKAAGQRPLGDRGVVVFGGTAYTEDKLKELAGGKKFDQFDRMVSDFSVIALGIRMFLDLISKASWQVTPAGGSEATQAQQDIADAVERAMTGHRQPWHKIIRKLAMFRFYGFTVLELTAERLPDGGVGWRSAAHRPQRTITGWELDEDGEVSGIRQRLVNSQEVMIPRAHCIYVVDDMFTDHPEGTGVLRHMARDTFRLRAFETIEEVAFETDLRGIPVGRAPIEVMDEAVAANTMQRKDAEKALDPLRKFIQGHIRTRKTGLLLDSATFRTLDDAKTPSSIRKWDAELLRGESNAYDAVANAITRLTLNLARMLGVEHAFMGGGQDTGSRAMHDSKTATLHMLVTSTLYEIVEAVEQDWKKPLCELNGWAEEDWPDMAVEDIQKLSIEQITQALRDMADAGMVMSPDDEAFVELFEMLGLTAPDPELREAEEALLPNPLDPEDPELDPEDEPVVTKRLRLRKRRGWIKPR